MIYDEFKYHCLIVISPPNTVIQDVKEIKRDFRLRHGDYDAQGSTAHITLNHEILDGRKVKQLISNISNSISSLHSFDLLLEKFDFFIDSATFYVGVKMSSELIRLQQMIAAEIQIVNPRLKARRYRFSPHMTIGKGLSRKQFGEAYYEFDGKFYREMFRVRDVAFLYKPIWDRKYRAAYLPLKSEVLAAIYW